MITKLPPGQSGQRVVARQAALALAAAATLLLLAACAGQPSATAQMHSAGAHRQLMQAGHPGSGHPVVVATQVPADPQASATPQPSATAAPVPAAQYTGPNFATPQAAMLFLAQAFNRHDNVALHAVTTPDAYKDLQTMRAGAINLRLLHCVVDGTAGDYTCYFRHDYPPRLHQSGHGEMQVIAAPAKNPGWYMYTLVDCG